MIKKSNNLITIIKLIPHIFDSEYFKNAVFF